MKIYIASLTMLAAAVAAAPSRELEDNANYYNNGNNYGDGNNANYYNNGNNYGDGNNANYYNNGNNYGGGNNANGNGGYYENFEEYMQAQMASRSFSITGCGSTPASGTGVPSYSYVTYRLCDQCSGGCSRSYGDYAVNMLTFSESFGEYIQETYGAENSPFECVRAEEYMENMYQNGNNYNYNNQQQNQNYQDGNYNYNNNNNNQQELFIGPHCSSSGGKSIQYGVFYDEECMYLADGMEVSQVLGGYSPDTSGLQPDSCLPCSSYNNQDGGGELSSLCSEEMLEQSSKCERTETESDFDKYVAAYGYNDEDQGNNNYNNGGSYYGTQKNDNTCSFIDSLQSGKWPKAKKQRSWKGLSQAGFVTLVSLGVIAAIAAVFYLAYYAGYHLTGCCEGKESEPFLHNFYQHDEKTPPTSEKGETKPSSYSSVVSEKLASAFAGLSKPETYSLVSEKLASAFEGLSKPASQSSQSSAGSKDELV